MVIVQRTGGRVKPLKDVTELIGKDVYVKPGKYNERLVNLDKELGGGIHIHKVSNDSITIEDLIMQVSQGKIPVIRKIEVGLNINPAETWSIALYSEFDTLDDVKFYAAHPDHVAAGKLIAEVKESRACVDYEV